MRLSPRFLKLARFLRRSRIALEPDDVSLFADHPTQPRPKELASWVCSRSSIHQGAITDARAPRLGGARASRLESDDVVPLRGPYARAPTD